MPPRVTYWAGTWNPQGEGISKEVETLRRSQSPVAPVVAFSPGNRSRLDWRGRVLMLSARRPWLFRALAPCVERAGDLNHVFGGLDSWFLLRAVGHRPTILTVVADGPRLEDRLYHRVSFFVAESPHLARMLARSRVPEDRIRLIFPGTNLSEFAVAPPPAERPFRILFASWPEHQEQLDKRGVFLLVEAARRCPDVEVVLLVRQWGDERGTRQAVLDRGLPANVTFESLGSRSMRDVYASVHATAALFAAGSGKSCPNSIVEGLACGRPALVSTDCGIAEPVSQRQAGVVVDRDVDAITAGIRRLQRAWTSAAENARFLAEDTFSEQAFIDSYQRLYHELASDRFAAGFVNIANTGEARS